MKNKPRKTVFSNSSIKSPGKHGASKQFRSTKISKKGSISGRRQLKYVCVLVAVGILLALFAAGRGDGYESLVSVFSRNTGNNLGQLDNSLESQEGVRTESQTMENVPQNNEGESASGANQATRSVAQGGRTYDVNYVDASPGSAGNPSTNAPAPSLTISMPNVHVEIPAGTDNPTSFVRDLYFNYSINTVSYGGYDSSKFSISNGGGSDPDGFRSIYINYIGDKSSPNSGSSSLTITATNAVGQSASLVVPLSWNIYDQAEPCDFACQLSQ